MPGRLRDLWYDAAYVSSHALMLFGWSLRTEGGRYLPRHGPVLLIANHQSFFDPVLVGVASRRRLAFLARKSLFRHYLFAALIRSYDAVPIDQEGLGKDGLRTILAQLERGRAVLVFPEGNRTHDGAMQPLRPGISLLIKRVQAPIVPVGIAGAFDAWPRTQPWPSPAPLFWPARRGTIAVSVGPPMDGRRFATMPRDQLVGELFTALQRQQQRAERLRRQA